MNNTNYVAVRNQATCECSLAFCSKQSFPRHARCPLEGAGAYEEQQGRSNRVAVRMNKISLKIKLFHIQNLSEKNLNNPLSTRLLLILQTERKVRWSIMIPRSCMLQPIPGSCNCLPHSNIDRIDTPLLLYSVTWILYIRS
jgi:hypothetical protein